jgi:hypothetical protein
METLQLITSTIYACTGDMHNVVTYSGPSSDLTNWTITVDDTRELIPYWECIFCGRRHYHDHPEICKGCQATGPFMKDYEE